MTTLGFVSGVFGNYRFDPSTTRYDCVIANSFGTSRGPSSVNAKIRSVAEAFALIHGVHIPLIMDETLSKSYYHYQSEVDHVVRGPVSDTVGNGVGTWGVLEEARDFMAEHRLSRPLLIGQAYHVNRIAVQARSREIALEPILMGYMPREFDKKSTQVWTRSLALWVPRELLGALVLKKQGKL